MTTVSYELSKKLHEKYPAMGEGSYWVWCKPGGIHGFISPDQVICCARNEVIENDAEWSIVCPALTLGELVYVEILINKSITPENALAQAIIEGGM